MVSAPRNRNDKRRRKQFARHTQQKINCRLPYFPCWCLAAMAIPVCRKAAKPNYLLDSFASPLLHSADWNGTVCRNYRLLKRMRMHRRRHPICSCCGAHCLPQMLCISAVVKSANPRTIHFLPRSSQLKTSSSLDDFGAPRAVSVICNTSLPSRPRMTGTNDT